GPASLSTATAATCWTAPPSAPCATCGARRLRPTGLIAPDRRWRWWRARALDLVEDMFGQTWLVTDARETPLGFGVLVGRPHPPSRQGATVILTADLAEAIDGMRDTPADLDGVLPIGRTTIKRLRKAMGYHWRADRLD